MPTFEKDGHLYVGEYFRLGASLIVDESAADGIPMFNAAPAGPASIYVEDSRFAPALAGTLHFPGTTVSVDVSGRATVDLDARYLQLSGGTLSGELRAGGGISLDVNAPAVAGRLTFPGGHFITKEIYPGSSMTDWEFYHGQQVSVPTYGLLPNMKLAMGSNILNAPSASAQALQAHQYQVSTFPIIASVRWAAGATPDFFTGYDKSSGAYVRIVSLRSTGTLDTAGGVVAGGTISTTGAISAGTTIAAGGTISTTGLVSAASVSATGTVSAAAVSATGDVSGGTVSVGATVVATSARVLQNVTFGAALVFPYGQLSGVPTSFNPSLHAGTHVTGGADPLSLNAAQLTAGKLLWDRLPTGTGVWDQANPTLLGQFTISGTAGAYYWTDRSGNGQTWGHYALSGDAFLWKASTGNLIRFSYANGGLDILVGGLSIGGNVVMTGARVLTNVTADAGILTGNLPWLRLPTGTGTWTANVTISGGPLSLVGASGYLSVNAPAVGSFAQFINDAAVTSAQAIGCGVPAQAATADSLVFSRYTGGIWAEVARFRAGALGIGTTDPLAVHPWSRLTVSASDGSGVYTATQNTGAGQAGLQLSRSGATPCSWIMYVPSGANELVFYSNTAAAVLRLTAAGAVQAGYAGGYWDLARVTIQTADPSSATAAPAGTIWYVY